MIEVYRKRSIEHPDFTLNLTDLCLKLMALLLTDFVNFVYGFAQLEFHGPFLSVSKQRLFLKSWICNEVVGRLRYAATLLMLSLRQPFFLLFMTIYLQASTKTRLLRQSLLADLVCTAIRLSTFAVLVKRTCMFIEQNSEQALINDVLIVFVTWGVVDERSVAQFVAWKA